MQEGSIHVGGIFSNWGRDLKGQEGHDKNVSCISGTSGRTHSVSYINRIDLDSRNAIHNQFLSSVMCLEDIGKGVGLASSGTRCDVEYSRDNSKEQSRSSEDSLKEIPSISFSVRKMDLHSTFSKVSSPSHVSLSSESPESSNSKDFREGSIVSQPKKLYNPHGIQVEARKNDLAGSFNTSKTNNVKLASEMNNSNRFQTWNSSGQSKLGEKLNNALEILNKQEPSLHSLSGDESDGSDAAEHDVNVCDICGDAGHENKLAICSRCSDGAEHIYCMREMLDEVPEGDWMCEECKCANQAVHQKHGKFEMVGEDEKNIFSECPTTDSVIKFDSKNAIVEDNINIGVDKTNKASQKIQVTGKRRVNSYEFAPVPKKQALNATIESPNPPNPHKTTLFSRDRSFKSLGNAGVKSSRHFTEKVSDASHSSAEKGFLNPKGSLLKSKSFCYSKVKPADENISQTQKGFNESAKSHEMKDVSVRSLGRSMTCKFGNSSRLNAVGPKVQMLSLNASHAQDHKGSKHGKKQSSFIRKNSLKMDHSTASSSIVSTLKDQRLKSHLDDISENDGDLKDVHSDGGLINSSNPKSNLTQEPSQCHDAICDIKKQSLCVPNAASSSFIDELVKSDEKNFKELSKNPIPRDSDVSDEKNASGQVGSSGGKLKAAIAAALLKKPRIYRTKSSDRPDGITSPSIDLNRGTVSEDLFSDPHNFKKSESSTAFSAQSESTSNAGNFDNHIHSAGNLSMGNLNHGASVTVPIPFKISVIPEQKYIWQGGFEMCRSGKHPDLCIGIQAHVSTFASPKVLDVVCKFSEKLALNEVARLNVWPLQFHSNGARDDNIAVFFFAKDLESYEKNYKCLLDSMMKKDLALKGNLDGFELLIFPSNQLPEKSQRWNMLFFLWGVFKEKCASRLNNIDDSLKTPSNASLNAVQKTGDNPATELRPSILRSSVTSNGNCNAQTHAINQATANLPKFPQTMPSSSLINSSNNISFCPVMQSMKEADGGDEVVMVRGKGEMEVESSLKEEGEWIEEGREVIEPPHILKEEREWLEDKTSSPFPVVEGDRSPNLELALGGGGGEWKPRVVPHGLRGEEEVVAAPHEDLSLSLSFPLNSNQQPRRPSLNPISFPLWRFPS